MTYPTPQSLIQSFSLTTRLINMQADGLSHADSLLSLPVRGNCFNWVLGHILVSRNRVLALLGLSVLWDDSQTRLYETGSEAITPDSKSLPLAELLETLEASQTQITTTLQEMPAEQLATPMTHNGNEVPLGQLLAGLHWHETYHTGQLEILRQLAGKNDAIV